jgi:hypothetical protein
MTKRLLIAFLALACIMLVAPSSAKGGKAKGDQAVTSSSDGADRLSAPSPDWYTPELHAEVLAAGPKGVEVKLGRGGGKGRNIQQTVEPNCLGYSPPYVGADGASLQAVSAGGCMVYPHYCSMNFVFTDGTSNYIGTAGHCASGTVVMQVATRVDPTDTVPIVTLAAIGKTVKRVNAGIGRDFALVKVDPAFKVVPGVAGAIGPTGVFCGDPVGQPVIHYGHGYVFAVEQGVLKEGVVLPDAAVNVLLRYPSSGFAWAGYGLPGDSGSDVMNAAGLAVGDLTHGLGVSGVPIPGLSFGTEMGEIFDIIGSGYSLVTVDGRSANCARPLGV